MTSFRDLAFFPDFDPCAWSNQGIVSQYYQPKAVPAVSLDKLPPALSSSDFSYVFSVASNDPRSRPLYANRYMSHWLDDPRRGVPQDTFTSSPRYVGVNRNPPVTPNYARLHQSLLPNAQGFCVKFQREQETLTWPLYIIERVLQQLFSDEKTLADRKVYLKACISRRPMHPSSPASESAFREIKQFPFLLNNDGIFISSLFFKVNGHQFTLSLPCTPSIPYSDVHLRRLACSPPPDLDHGAMHSLLSATREQLGCVQHNMLVLLQLRDRIREQRATLKRLANCYHNLVYPSIHRVLPEHVLSEIFMHCALPYGGEPGQADNMPHTLTRVCRYWYHIAWDNTPRLWASAVVNIGRGLVKRARVLEHVWWKRVNPRSSVSLTLIMPSKIYLLNPIEGEALMQAIRSNSFKLTTLYFHGVLKQAVEVVFTALIQGDRITPRRIERHIHLDNLIDSPRVFCRLLRGQNLNLTSLDLAGRRWYCPPHEPLRVSRALNILAACVVLERCTLRDIEDDEPDYYETHPDLTKLKYLRQMEIHTSHPGILLDQLQVRRLQFVRVEYPPRSSIQKLKQSFRILCQNSNLKVAYQLPGVVKNPRTLRGVVAETVTCEFQPMRFISYDSDYD
ncbi:hypothetical protein PQX77_008048 [Marasmius sp. AFHP31]|nr:hypothetical protein PQX77_008048 [Marasmius sp. AFHP31]